MKKKPKKKPNPFRQSPDEVAKNIIEAQRQGRIIIPSAGAPVVNGSIPVRDNSIPVGAGVPGIQIPIEDDALILYALCLHAMESKMVENVSMAQLLPRMVGSFEMIFKQNGFRLEQYRKYYIPVEKPDDEPEEPEPEEPEPEEQETTRLAEGVRPHAPEGLAKAGGNDEAH